MKRPTARSPILTVAAAAISVSVLLSGCTNTVRDREPTASPSPGSAERTTAGAIATLGEPIELATGLESPWGLTFLPDGSALVSERLTGEILRVPADGGQAQTVGVVPDVQVSAEGGLLGIVASPAFEQDRTVYASVSGVDENRIVALTIAEDYRALAVDRVLLDGIQTADRHHGGRIVNGPDGNLWIGTGDAFEPENAATEPPSTARSSASVATAPSPPTTPRTHRSTPAATAMSKASRSDQTAPSTPPNSGIAPGTR